MINKENHTKVINCRYCKSLMLLDTHGNTATFFCSGCNYAQAPHDTPNKIVQEMSDKELKLVLETQ